MNLYDELLGLADVLEKHQLEYALCGGLAVVIHGYPRLTTDIDLLIRGEDLSRANDAIKECGFTVHSGRIPFHLGQPEEQIAYRVLKIVDRMVLTLDLMILPPFLEDVWKDRIVIEWRGRRVKIVSREGLARMKRLAGRKQDLADLDRLGFPTHGDPTPPQRG